MADILDLKEDIDRIERNTEHILRVLNGNGNEGLVTRIAVICRQTDDFEKRITYIEKYKWWNSAIQFGGGVVGGITAMLGKWAIFK